MDLINGIVEVFRPMNLWYCFLGCTLGTLVGVLPGLGPASTLAILLPLTVYLDPTGSIIMLAGLYYGAQYGGSTTSILVNIPGESSSVATCLDGFQMTRQGRAGQALWIAAIGSFIAGTFGCIMMSVIGPGVAKYALKFGPPEYVGLLVLSLTAIISFSGVSLTKGLGVGLIGLILATVGIDSTTGAMRFCFGSLALTRGFDLIPVVVGLFGIGEILESTEEGRKKIFEGKLGKMMPRGEELKKGLWASLRGTMVGFWPGVLPGMVPTLTTFLAYDLEKKYSKYPERFGTGVIEGVAAPEAANNATVQAGFIPLFALGIPTGPANAMILASLMLYGLVPGPTMFRENSVFVWTVIASMYMGNVMLVVLNLPLVGLWARVSLLPYKFLAPAVLGICLIGAYSPRNAMFDLWVAIGAGILGYFMKKMNWPTMPLILGLILGSMFEQALRQSFAMGGPMIFLKRPVAVCLILLAIIIMLISLKYLKRIPKAVLLEGNTDS